MLRRCQVVTNTTAAWASSPTPTQLREGAREGALSQFLGSDSGESVDFGIRGIDDLIFEGAKSPSQGEFFLTKLLLLS